jgi:hypothetical protein
VRQQYVSLTPDSVLLEEKMRSAAIVIWVDRVSLATSSVGLLRRTRFCSGGLRLCPVVVLAVNLDVSTGILQGKKGTEKN